VIYVPPNHDGAIVRFRARYENFIGGDWVKPAKREYLENVTPVTGRGFCEVARASNADVETALDAADAARASWGKTSPADRAFVLSKIADRIEAHLEKLAVAESWVSGGPIRETLAADLPLVVEQLRFFAGAIRAQEGSVCEVEHDTALFHFGEPLGVVAQITPASFPLLTAVSMLAPALAAGNCVVIQAAEQSPASLMMLVDLVGDLLPPGVVNVLGGFVSEGGRALASSSRVEKVVFAGDTIGRSILPVVAESFVPVAYARGGESPNVFFDDILAANDDLADTSLDAFASFASWRGETAATPARALVARSIFERFVERAVERTARHQLGNPLDLRTTVGAVGSRAQVERVLASVGEARREGAKVLAGGMRAEMPETFAKGMYVVPTILQVDGDRRGELFGPVIGVTSFRDFDHAVRLVNQRRARGGAGVWTRDNGQAYRAGRALDARRVWSNSHHRYPAHASMPGLRPSGLGREGDRATLTHYQQRKNLLVSYTTGR
jgi:aldehyde dehydrogenase